MIEDRGHTSARVDTIAARLRQLVAKATPRPWVAERSRSYDEFIHWTIRTVEKLAAHPWSPRYIVWLNGGLGEILNRYTARGQVTWCPECKHQCYRWREIAVDLRVDEMIEADLELIVTLANNAEAFTELLEAARYASDVCFGLEAEARIRAALERFAPAPAAVIE